MGHAAIIDLLKEVDGNGDGVIDFQVWMVVKGQGNWSRRMGMMNDVLFFFVIYFFLETLGTTTYFLNDSTSSCHFFEKE